MRCSAVLLKNFKYFATKYCYLATNPYLCNIVSGDCNLLETIPIEYQSKKMTTNVFMMRNQTNRTVSDRSYVAPEIEIFRMPVEGGFNASLKYGEEGSAAFGDEVNNLGEF